MSAEIDSRLLDKLPDCPWPGCVRKEHEGAGVHVLDDGEVSA